MKTNKKLAYQQFVNIYIYIYIFFEIVKIL